jgi:hypothetical protein
MANENGVVTSAQPEEEKKGPEPEEQVLLTEAEKIQLQDLTARYTGLKYQDQSIFSDEEIKVMIEAITSKDNIARSIEKSKDDMSKDDVKKSIATSITDSKEECNIFFSLTKSLEFLDKQKKESGLSKLEQSEYDALNNLLKKYKTSSTQEVIKDFNEKKKIINMHLAPLLKKVGNRDIEIELGLLQVMQFPFNQEIKTTLFKSIDKANKDLTTSRSKASNVFPEWLVGKKPFRPDLKPESLSIVRIQELQDALKIAQPHLLSSPSKFSSTPESKTPGNKPDGSSRQ